MNKYVKFNPAYTLKQDNGRVLIIATQLGRESNLPPQVSDAFETFVHPLYAKIFCFFNGDEKDVSIKKAAEELQINKSSIEYFVNRIIDNESFNSTETKLGSSSFPPYTLISSSEKPKEITERYDYKIFECESADLSPKRHYTPTTLVLMVNTRCLTNCFYCYADRRKKMDCQIPIDRIKELIVEARKLNVRNFDVIGGEFFLYKEWEILVRCLIENNFTPYLSTKIPLKEDEIKKLKNLDVQDIQVSLDTLIKDRLPSIINVSESYVDKIKNTISLLHKYGIKTIVHTVLSSKNDSVEDIKSVFEFIKDFENMIEWKIDRAGKSLYLEESYDNIKPRESNIELIDKYVESIKDNTSILIRAPKPIMPHAIRKNTNKTTDAMTTFLNRGICSANYSGLFILPDGQVTICEELYWIPQFIIGNVLTQNIEEIWNSDKAINLYNIKQSDIPSDSLCSKCNIFSKCRSFKQVCYREIIKEFGKDKWYYPDLACPQLKKVAEHI